MEQPIIQRLLIEDLHEKIQWAIALEKSLDQSKKIRALHDCVIHIGQSKNYIEVIIPTTTSYDKVLMPGLRHRIYISTDDNDTIMIRLNTNNGGIGWVYINLHDPDYDQKVINRIIKELKQLNHYQT